jgi:hypothetical protein
LSGLTEEAERELGELRELVAPLAWRFARTIAQWPHHYIVRGKTADEELYVRLFRAIRTHGQDQKFGPFKNRYLHLGDGWKYWAMTDDETTSKILNRDQQLDPATFRRAEGAAPPGRPGGARGRRPAEG